jgi:actin-related protein
MITNWDELEQIWHKIFYDELRVEPTEQPVLIIDPSLNSKVNRETTAQIMYEVFNVPGFFIGSHA